MVDCAFHLTDDDMENLTATLPQLKTLQLGNPCDLNSCDTTVASLLSISVHCLDLTSLQTHFSTRAIVSDMQRLLDGGAECDKSKCRLRELIVGSSPLEVGREDIEIVAMGFKAIFPCLADVQVLGGSWYQLKSKLV